MKFVVTSGGTAGHIYPAQAVAIHLLELGHDVVFAGTPGGMESQMIPEAGIEYVAFEAKGFDRSKPLSLVSSTALITKSTTKAKIWLKAYQPNAVAAFGGYVSVPVGRAASQLKIPLLIHEQNSAPGWANRYLAAKADAVALTYADAQAELKPNSKALVQITGNPVRQDFKDLLDSKILAQTRADFRTQLKIPSDALVLLVFGGSQGARHINNAVVALAAQLTQRPNLQVIQITGPKEFESVQAALKTNLAQHTEALKRWHLIDYCKQMPGAYSAADLIVGRAGASSLAELATIGAPTILVPYPFATNNHQQSNAKTLVEAGAAAMILDSQLDSDEFSSTLFELLDNDHLRIKMAAAAKTLKPQNATESIKKLLIQIAKT